MIARRLITGATTWYRPPMLWGSRIVGSAMVLAFAACTPAQRPVSSLEEGGADGDGTSGNGAVDPGGKASGGSAEPGGTGGTSAGTGSGGTAGRPDQSCEDTQTDEKNCGSCGVACDAGQVCTDGACTTPAPHCEDDELSGDETDLNCGGSCAPCENDAACEVAADCQSGFCNGQSACAAPRCDDASNNGEETGLDCGGEVCRALNLLCNNDEGCGEDGDCKTGYCKGGACQSPSCSDEAQNQGETAVDCGGPVCRQNVSPLGTCANGQRCLVNEDCTSRFCDNQVCKKPTCDDGAKNQDETGQDCGGVCSAQSQGKCADGVACKVHADCGSGFCAPGKLCAPAGCNNGNKDPNETDQDCGGDGCRATKPCAVGQACVIHADCGSGSCSNKKCIAATCDDGIKNQGETATDCGGPTCSSAGKTCANGQACTKNGDCTDGFCLNNSCSGACKNAGPKLGCPCTPDNSLACAGTAQSVKLICIAGSWATNGVPCPSGYNCSGGSCKEIIGACASVGAGKSYCEAATPSTKSYLCDADLVSSSPTNCSGVCSNGACQAARCGDGRKQSGEECDDGNNVALDGCETDCKASKVLSLSLGNGFTCALTQGGYVRCWGANGSNELGFGDTVFRQTQEPFELTKADGTTPAGPIDLGGSATAVTTGVGHACALLTDGTARCWGDNTYGQLGLGNASAQVKTPNAIGAVKVAASRKITKISAGARHTCAVLDDATATCWGQNDVGQLGLGNTNPVSETQTPAQIGAISLGGSVISLGSGAGFSCALLSGGKVRCWGSGNLGRLGTGNLATHGNVGDNELPSSLGDSGTVPIVSGSNVVDLKVGSSHACVLLSNDRLECWGQNTTGAIGIGDPSNIGDNESPATFGGPIFAQGERVQAFALGFSSTCALVTGQGLRCWGLNTSGQAGYARVDNLGTTTGTVPSALGQVNAGSGRTVKSVYAGTSATCAILDDDSVKCWGWNSTGQLGFGTVSSSPDYIGGPGKTPDTLAAIRIFVP